MARRPSAALPDVFAKPGNAPARGTSIEDLPTSGHAATSFLAEEDRPPTPPEPPPAPLHMLPPPRLDPPPLPDRPLPPDRLPPLAGAARTIAFIALAVALTAPFWEGPLLASINLRTPDTIKVEQTALTAERNDRKIADAEQRLAAASADITRLQADLAQVARRGADTARNATMLAMIRLSDALRRTGPFETELALLHTSGADLAPIRPLLDQIEPYATMGIPGPEMLRQDFRTLQDRVARSERGLLPTGWMSDLVSWTRLPGTARSTPADTTLDLLRTAGGLLAEADVAGALDQAQTISAAYQPIFAPWLEDAKARVAADAVVAKVTALVAAGTKPAGR